MAQAEAKQDVDPNAVYQVSLFITNNTPWGLVPHNPPTAEWYGYSTSGPVYAGPNTTGVAAGVFVAEKATWTGTTAISVYDLPDASWMIGLLIMEPFSGINNARVGVQKSTDTVNTDLVKQIWKYGSTSQTFPITVNGTKHILTISGSIEQGTVVNANFTLDLVSQK